MFQLFCTDEITLDETVICPGSFCSSAGGQDSACVHSVELLMFWEPWFPREAKGACPAVSAKHWQTGMCKEIQGNLKQLMESGL